MRRTSMPAPGEILPGRSSPIVSGLIHFLNKQPLHPPFPAETLSAMFGMGCFWGAEKRFWDLAGIHVTAVGYSGGGTPNPSYEEVCSGNTGHNEVVLVVYHPGVIAYGKLLKIFFESHDPTQGMRQGNDIGTQYRSGIYTFSSEQQSEALKTRDIYARELASAGYPAITTEIREAREFYYAEEYHQQYLARNPNGYCGLGGTGVSCQI